MIAQYLSEERVLRHLRASENKNHELYKLVRGNNGVLAVLQALQVHMHAHRYTRTHA